MTKRAECICGADIHTVGVNDGVLWVDDRGNERCYPTEPGADGQARHDPLEETITDEPDDASTSDGAPC